MKGVGTPRAPRPARQTARRADRRSPPDETKGLTSRERRAQARLRSAQDSPEQPGRSWSRLAVGIAVAAACALAIGLALATGFLAPGSGTGSATPAAGTTTVLRGESASVAFASSDGWVADDTAGTVRRFSASDGKWLARAVRTGGRPVAVATGYGRVWTADTLGNTVTVLDESTGKLFGAPVSVGQEPVSVATGEGGVWVASLLSGSVSLLDPSTRKVRASVALPDGAVRVAVGDGYVWVTGQTDTLTRVDPRPLGVSLRWKQVTVGKGPIGVSVGLGSVWVANAESGTLSRVDPNTLRVTGTFRVGQGGSASDPDAVVVSQGHVWVGEGESPTVVALDPSSGRQYGAAVTLPGTVRDLAVGDGGLWATTANVGAVVRLTPD